MAKDTVANVPSYKADSGIPVDVPCSEIFFDRSWNSRREVSANHSDDGGSAGYPNLVCSLAHRKLDGEKYPQRDPCTVRPNPDFGKKKGEAGRRFLGVAGFQRHDAILFTAMGRSDEVTILTDPLQGGLTPEQVKSLESTQPTVRVFIKDLTEAQARAENLAENMQRSTLSGPDIAFGVMKLFEADPKLTDTQAAIILGNNQPFVSKLRRITEGTKNVMVPPGALYAGSKPMSLLDAWREAPKKISQNDLDAIAKKATPEEKVDTYLVKTGKKDDAVPAKPKPATGPGSWLTNAINVNAPVVGALLGTLQRLGVITVSGRFSDEAIRAALAPFRTVPVDATTKGDNAGSHAINMAKMGDAIQAAIQAALVEPESVKPEPTPVVATPRVNGAKSDGKVARRIEE